MTPWMTLLYFPELLDEKFQIKGHIFSLCTMHYGYCLWHFMYSTVTYHTENLRELHCSHSSSIGAAVVEEDTSYSERNVSLTSLIRTHGITF